MTIPSLPEYFDAAMAAYDEHDNTSNFTVVPEPGWKILLQSPPSELTQGFYATAYEDTGGNIIIAYEGTDLSAPSYGPGTLAADADIALNRWPTALSDAVNFADQVTGEFGHLPVYVTGHSLGGAEAEAAIAYDAQVAGGDTFGAPGLPTYTGFTLSSNANKLVNYIDEGDFIANYANDGSNATLASLFGFQHYHVGNVAAVGASHSGDLNALVQSTLPALIQLVLDGTLPENFIQSLYQSVQDHINDYGPDLHLTRTPLSTNTTDMVAASTKTTSTIQINSAGVQGAIDTVDESWGTSNVPATTIASDGTPVDKDWYKIATTAGATYTVSASSLGITTGSVAISLKDRNGNTVFLPGNSNGFVEGSNPTYTFTATDTTYYVAVSAGGGGTSWEFATGNYAVQVNQAQTVSDDTVSETVPGILTTTAGVTAAIHGVKIVDDGLNGETFTVQVLDAIGRLTASGNGISGSGTTTLTITGALGSVNAALATLSYTNNASGADTILIKTTDNADNSTASADINVTVNNSVNADDIVSEIVPPSIKVKTGLQTTIGGVQIIDDGRNGETFTVVISDSAGALSADGAGVSGAGSKSLTIVGGLNQVNAALVSLSYLNNNAGSDTILVSTVDNGDGSVSSNSIAVQISATPVDTTPPTLVADAPLNVQIGATASITASLLKFSAVDNSDDAQLRYTVLTSPTSGTLLKGGIAATTFTQADIDNGLISYRETASNVSSDLFTFSVSDAAGNTTANQSFQIQVSGTSNSPTALSGTISGPLNLTGATTLNSHVFLDHSVVNGNIVNAVINNSGIMTVGAGGAISSDGTSGDTFDNLSGGALVIDAPSLFDFMPTFLNAGLMTVDPGAGNTFEITSYLNFPGPAFNNTGTVQVQSGTFDIFQGGSSTATGFSVAAGAAVLFRGGLNKTFTFTGGTYSVAGTTEIGNANSFGDLIFAAGTTVNLGNSWSIYGTLDLSAATLAGAFDGLVLSGGSLIFGSNDVSIADLNMQSDPTISDSKTVALTGNATLGGTFDGGTLDIIGASTVSNDVLYLGNGAAVENNGTLILSGAGIAPNGGSGNTITNNSGATISIQGAGATLNAPIINNAGAISIDASSAFITGFLNNAGIIELQSGTAYLSGGGTANPWGYQVSAGATLNFSSGTFIFTGGTYNAGGATGNSGIWKFLGPATISSSIVNDGTIEGNGTLTIGALESGSGTILLDSGTTLALASPSTFTNSISGFTNGNTIDLLGVAASTALLNNNNQLVIRSGSAVVATLKLSGTIASGPFYVTSDGNGGSDITTTAPPSDTMPPSLVHLGSVSVLPGGTATIPEIQLQFDDGISTHAQEIYTLVAPPSHGTVLDNGLPTSSFTQADVDSGLISYQASDSIAASDSFAFTVTDAAGNQTTTKVFQIQSNPDVVVPNYDVNGNMVSQTIKTPSGAQWVNAYDSENTSNSLWSTSSYDANGNLLSQTATNDDGTHSLTMYDVNNSYNWSSATINFDAQWNQTSVSGTNDDGSHTTTPKGLASAYDTALWFATPFDPNWNSTTPVTLAGDSANDFLVGNAGNDMLVAGTGNDILYGNGGSNTFAFGPGSGQDKIMDFQTDQDVIQFNPALFANYAAVMQDTTQVGANTVIQHDANTSVALENTLASSLTANNFHFS